MTKLWDEHFYVYIQAEFNTPLALLNHDTLHLRLRCIEVVNV